VNLVSPVTCREFDEAADELAVGGASEPERTALLVHAASCTRCAALLDELASVADHLLLVAPEVDPPPGFESRALALMADAPDHQIRAGGRAGWRSRPRRAVVAVAAAALVAGVAGGAALDRAAAPSGRRGSATSTSVGRTRSGSIVTAAGVAIGTARISPAPRPHVLVSLDHGQPVSGTLSCELELADGRRATVGSWSYLDIRQGVWAVGIDPSLTGAVRMRILDDHAAVVATATLA